MNPVFTSMTLNGLELSVFLGWPEAERQQKQTVIMDLQLHFATPPSACVSDQLEDTPCYDALIAKIKACVAERPFHLLEHLTQAMYQTIKDHLAPNTRVNCRIKKLPLSYLPDLKEGVTFQYGDDAITWSY